jgi:hypothetical protein
MKNVFIVTIGLCFFLMSCGDEGLFHAPDKWTKVVLYPDYEWQGISVTGKTVFVYGIKMNEADNNLSLLYKLIRSDDGGKSWELVYDKPDIWSRGGWDYIHFINTNKGFFTGSRTLFTTVDGGLHWDTLSLGMNDFYKIYQLDADHLFGYEQYGFFRSNDGGATWIKDSLIHTIRAIDFINKSTGFMVGEYGSFKTTNGGETWKNNGNYTANFTCLDYLDEENAIAFTAWSQSRDEYPTTFFNITHDGGITWEKTKPDSLIVEPGSCLLYKSLAAIYAGGVTGVFSSSDSGKSWQKECSGSFIRDLKMVDGHILAVGYGGEILRK